MNKNFSIFAFVSMIMACFLSSVFVYPIFSKYTNITTKDMQTINNFYETELYPYEEEEEINDNPTNETNSQIDKNTEQSKIEPQKINVSNLNWFDTVHNQFPTYTKTRVIDIKSGLTYFVYRNGGHYHADVEPINQANTDIFYKIYNYEWSWTRRPVWVEIKPDFWVAASINGYPHGNSYIKNTGMNGHTCIHFLLSKTHGTKRVDEGHQSCVQYAYDHRDEINKFL